MSEVLYDVPCTLGLEEVLEAEVAALGGEQVRRRRGGITCRGDRALGYRLCLWARSAIRVQEVLAEFPVDLEQDLYDGVAGLPWEQWITPEQTLAVDATVRDSVLTHSGYAAVRVKDAVCDRMRDLFDRRPSVDRDRPDLPLRLRLVKGRASLARDLAGDSLHKRGYRPVQVKSPLNEATAAGLLLLASYDGRGTLLDPMCGSATFLVEAAWIAMDRAPGLGRRFAFQRWPDFEPDTWDALNREALGRVDFDTEARFVGLERHAGAVQLARKAVAAAEVDELVRIEQGDAERWRPDRTPEWIATNPPWGERLDEGAEQSWDALARLLRDCPGARAHVLSGNPALSGRLKLKADRRWAVRNGPIDCRWLRYAVHGRPSDRPAKSPGRDHGGDRSGDRRGGRQGGHQGGPRGGRDGRRPSRRPNAG